MAFSSKEKNAAEILLALWAHTRVTLTLNSWKKKFHRGKIESHLIILSYMPGNPSRSVLFSFLRTENCCGCPPKLSN